MIKNELISQFEIKCRREKIEEIWSEFDHVQITIELIGYVNYDEKTRYRIKFEDAYFNAVKLGNSLL